jgi:hypothetical protein
MKKLHGQRHRNSWCIKIQFQSKNMYLMKENQANEIIINGPNPKTHFEKNEVNCDPQLQKCWG